MNKWLIFPVLLALSSTFTHAKTPSKPPIKTLADVGVWAEKMVLCQASPFSTETGNKQFPKLMKKLGLKSNISYFDDTGIHEGSVFINQDIKVHGFNLKEIYVEYDSGIVFTATLEATPEQLLQLLKSKKLTQYPIARKGTDAQLGDYIFSTKKPTKHNGQVFLYEILTIDKTKNKNISKLSCQELDN